MGTLSNFVRGWTWFDGKVPETPDERFRKELLRVLEWMTEKWCVEWDWTELPEVQRKAIERLGQFGFIESRDSFTVIEHSGSEVFKVYFTTSGASAFPRRDFFEQLPMLSRYGELKQDADGSHYIETGFTILWQRHKARLTMRGEYFKSLARNGQSQIVFENLCSPVQPLRVFDPKSIEGKPVSNTASAQAHAHAVASVGPITVNCQPIIQNNVTIDEAPIADLLRAKTEVNPPDLLQLTVNLKGKQRDGLEFIITHGCQCKLADLAIHLKWPRPFDDAWSNFRRDVNENIRQIYVENTSYKLKRHDSCAILEKIQEIPPVKKQASRTPAKKKTPPRKKT